MRSRDCIYYEQCKDQAGGTHPRGCPCSRHYTQKEYEFDRARKLFNSELAYKWSLTSPKGTSPKKKGRDDDKRKDNRWFLPE